MDPNYDSHEWSEVIPQIGDGDLTILLLGETGVGKSTWINGFANFLKFDSLDVAEKGSTLCLIPASFTVTDDNYKERLVSIGSDKNEVMDAGKSATQQPQTYSFPKDNRMIRLIDTPGIGDVRGVKQDKKNFEMILDHISHLPHLNAVCILLKPNNARLNIMFQFCIKELLTHLHKDACRNIVFCFTNSRSTFYRPGDTLPALRKLLEETNNIPIPLDQSTLYCMDNEAIRFLYALIKGIPFTPEERNNYNVSWQRSVAEIKRLLQHASEQEPHLVKNTLSLNNARQTILALQIPMAEVTRNIQININLKESQKEFLTTSKISKEELSKEMFTQEYDVQMKILSAPRTICTAPRCVDLIKSGFGMETIYKTQCHKGCGTGKHKHFKIANIVGHKNLKKCSAFDSKGVCKLCHCSWKVHMKINFETITKPIQIPEKMKELINRNADNQIQQSQTHLTEIKDNLKTLREEQSEITKAYGLFARFLKSNAITPYNDSMDPYLEHFINEEQNKVNQGDNSKLLEAMKNMRIQFQQEMEILEVAMQDGRTGPVVTPAKLEDCINKLYGLKFSGAKLEDMMNQSQYTARLSYIEKLIETDVTTTTTVKPAHSRNRNYENNPFHDSGLKSKPKTVRFQNLNEMNSEESDVFLHNNAVNKDLIYEDTLGRRDNHQSAYVQHHSKIKPKLPEKPFALRKSINRFEETVEPERLVFSNTYQPSSSKMMSESKPTSFRPEITESRASLLSEIRQQQNLRKVSTRNTKPSTTGNNDMTSALIRAMKDHQVFRRTF